MVAKSYQKYPIVGEPFTIKNRQYVNIQVGAATKQVRFYTEAEYNKMYGLAATEPPRIDSHKSLKCVLGFDKGYITIFAGDTFAALEWFRSSIARFHKLFGWYIVSTDELPQDIPFGLEPKQLSYEKVFKDEDTLLPDEQILEAINELLYTPTTSNYVGTVGERIDSTLTVLRAVPVEGNYGTSTIHTMLDANQNEFVWITAARTLTEGHTYKVRGTIKAHKTFRNSKQTVLTRCQVSEVSA